MTGTEQGPTAFVPFLLAFPVTSRLLPWCFGTFFPTFVPPLSPSTGTGHCYHDECQVRNTDRNQNFDIRFDSINKG